MEKDREVTISLSEYAMLVTTQANLVAMKNYIYANVEKDNYHGWFLEGVDKMMNIFDTVTWRTRVEMFEEDE